MFLAKLFETFKLSDGCSVLLLQHVNYVTPHFLSKNTVNKVVKVAPEYTNWPHIYNNMSFPTDNYVYTSC